MKNNGKQSKTKENEKKNEVANEKKWKFGLKVADSHSEPGNLQKRAEIFIFLSFYYRCLIIFYHFFSFSLPVAPEIQESHEKQWKTIKNKGKWKKNEVANEKNENLDSKLQILIPNQEIFKNSRTFSFFHQVFLFFFIFLARGTWNTGKPWKTMKNNGKQSKTKENEKKWSCKWKKMKFWTQSCRFSLRTRKSSKTRGFHFFLSFFYHCFIIFFSFSLPVAPEIQESHEKQWKTMGNHQKQRKMKTNEVANEKKWNFGLKVADSHSEPGNLKKLEDFFIFFIIFLSLFYHFFFHFPCPWHLKSKKAMKNNEKQWKTIKNKGKWKKMKLQMKKMKFWAQSCRFSLRTRKSSKTRGNFHFFIIFFSLSLPVAPEIQESHENQWKTIQNHQKQRKTKKNEVANGKNEVAN